MTLRISDLAKHLPVGPVACRLHCSPAVHAALVAATGPDPQDYRAPAALGTLKALQGIPVHIDETLAPNGWRIVDADGSTMSEGTIGTGVERDAVPLPDDGTGWAEYRPGPLRIVP